MRPLLVFLLLFLGLCNCTDPHDTIVGLAEEQERDVAAN
jgi:hypothetical protein